jgi:hypothetical protein
MFNERIYPVDFLKIHKSSIQSDLSSAITSGVVSDTRTNNLKVHDRLYEKSKSPLRSLKDLPSPLMKYSERKIL